jgi:hypothetical protein
MNSTIPNKNTIEENDSQIIPAKITATLSSNVTTPIQYKIKVEAGSRTKEKKLKYINPIPVFWRDFVRIWRKRRNLL